MKSEFRGYYRPSNKEIKKLWDSCVFSVDTNVLLDLYRISESSRNKLLAIFESVQERLWITHQAALEYQENRLEVISGQEDTFQKVSDLIWKTETELETIFRRGHLSIDTDTLLTKVKKTFESVTDELTKQKKDHPDLYNDDPIRDRLTPIFADHVIPPFTQEELNRIFEDGNKRYENKIPPGYLDIKKEGAIAIGNTVIQRKFGDLIIWKQLISLAKTEKKPVIFITSDAKQDWWWETRGKKIGPRAELIAEMDCEAGMGFYMYDLNRFIDLARKYVGADVDQELIDEVRDIAQPRGDWKSFVLQALWKLGGSAHLSEIYEYVENISDESLPESWQAIIRKTLQQYSSDTESYIGKEDLFASYGAGVWSIRDRLGFSFQDVLNRNSAVHNRLDRNLSVHSPLSDQNSRDKVNRRLLDLSHEELLALLNSKSDSSTE